jgi:hypothetical protein
MIGRATAIALTSAALALPAIGGAAGTVKSGSYVGDGADPRIIEVGFKSTAVMVTRGGQEPAVMRTSCMVGDVTKELLDTGNRAFSNDRIEAITATGFQVGNNNDVNEAGGTYYWVAMQEEATAYACGSYTGNGLDNRAIPLPFSPGLVWVLPAGDQPHSWKISPMNGDAAVAGRAGLLPDVIQQLGVNAFQIGASVIANDAGQEYHYLAIRGAERLAVAAIVGDGDPTNFTTGISPNPVIKPEYVLIKGGGEPVHRMGGFGPGDMTTYLEDNLDPIGGCITVLGNNSATGGFSLGNHAACNAQGQTYYLAALGNSDAAPPPPPPPPPDGGTEEPPPPPPPPPPGGTIGGGDPVPPPVIDEQPERPRNNNQSPKSGCASGAAGGLALLGLAAALRRRRSR